MRVFYLFFFISGSSILFFACRPNNTSPVITGNWVNRFDAAFSSRTEAVCFTIGDTAFIGTGFDGTNTLTDFWKLTMSASGTDFTWTQTTSLPAAAARSSAVAFASSTRGYVVTGKASDGATRLKDTWEYDPAGSWTRKSDFGGTARFDAVAFAIHNQGYLCTGYDGGNTKDCWKYDPAADAWTQLTGFTGFKRSQAVAFVHANKGYIVTGLNNSVFPNDFWMYDPAISKWTQLRSISNVSTDGYDDQYTSIVRSNAAAFVMNAGNNTEKAYLCTGQNNALYKNVWEYNFETDLWTLHNDFEGGARTAAIGFSLHGRGFLSSGNVSSQVFSDFWEFHPEETYNAND